MGCNSTTEDIQVKFQKPSATETEKLKKEKKRKIDMTLILGTSSQFRRKLFQENFSEFLSKDEKIEQFVSPDIDEKAIRDSDSEKLCQKIAVAKCEAILKEYEGKLPKDSIILTFDQVVVCDGELREKPVDESEARKFLESYSEGSNTFSD